MFRIKKQLKKSIFIIESLSHPEKTTSSGYLGNYRFLTHKSEVKNSLELKATEKVFYLQHKIYQSSRKSYIIMLSQKLSTFEFLRIDYEEERCLQSKNNRNFFYPLHQKEYKSHPEKATSSCNLGKYQILSLKYEDKNCLE